MMKYFRLLLAGGAFWLAGCAAPRPIDVAESHIDRDGCFRIAADETLFFDRVNSVLDDAAGTALRGKNPWSRRSAELLLKIRAAVDAGGLDCWKAYAASSFELRPRSVSGAGLFRNREFWYLSPSEKPFAALLPEKNQPFDPEFRRIAGSSGMLASGSFVFNAADVLDLLEGAGAILPDGVPELGGDAELRERLHRSGAGMAEFAVFLPVAEKGKKSEVQFFLRMPDRSGELFGLLSAAIEKNALGWRSGETTSFFSRDNGRDNFLLYRDGAHSVITSGNATASELGKLPHDGGDNEFFKSAAALSDGIAYCYIGKGFYSAIARLLEQLFPKQFMIFPVSADLIGFNQLTVYRREADGIAATGYADCDQNTAARMRSMLPAFLLGEKLLGETVRSSVASDQAVERGKVCRAALAKQYAILCSYADAHGGNFPATSGANGLAELSSLIPEAERKELTCPGAKAEPGYLYFGGFRRDGKPDFPLLIDGIGNHPGRINVLFLDGRVREFQVENPASAKHIVSFLHTVFHYSISDFQLLLRKAAELDRPDAPTEKP